jgi:IclR family transcriptional regulator, pca regulon regulatory protein
MNSAEVRQIGKSEGMSGLAKGLAILEAFARQPALTIADAARASDVTRAAARRCLLTLADLGYVAFDGKFFRPLPRMLRLGCGFCESMPLPQVAQPILDKARDELNESVSLAVRDSTDALFVARAEAQRIVSTGVKIGARLPAFCSATGRVLLGALPEGRVKDIIRRSNLVQRTPKTLVDPLSILNAIRMARQNGYAASNEELELGMISMAVPVIDRTGQTTAAMSVSASSARIHFDRMLSLFLPVLQRHAHILSKSL